MNNKPSALHIIQRLRKMWEYTQILPCVPWEEYLNRMETTHNYTRLVLKRYDWNNLGIYHILDNHAFLIKKWLIDNKKVVN